MKLLVMAAVLFGCQARGAHDPEPMKARAAAPSHAVQPASGAAAVAAEPRQRSIEQDPVERRELSWVFEASPFGRIDVVARVPKHPAGARLRWLLAFHGRGETLKGSARGARGWLDDYGLERTLGRLQHAPLTREDFAGFVAQERLERINLSLQRHPFVDDLIVVMPYLPDVLKGDAVFTNGQRLAEFIVNDLIPAVEQRLPVQGGASARGVDGVSLGGRAALSIGLAYPDAFRTLGATQPAIDDTELSRWTKMAERAVAVNPELQIRLLTSHDDYYRAVVLRFAERLNQKGVPHRLDVVSGDHSYEFNRGPGGIEMMLFHSSALEPSQ